MALTTAMRVEKCISGESRNIPGLDRVTIREPRSAGFDL